ncbi:glutathionylspermidine synthase family protein [Tundrisphaera sp. TA3]|uniref:glutathionylspermidine synthase family protein n=1 Tax=Tundrisphaera sp. TA3 TaxID=3435775 RepID=UPI003EBD7191
MLRVPISPRADWRKRVEAQGLLFHTIDDEAYWDESAYYLFEADEIDQIERATIALDAMCLEAVDSIIEDGRLEDLGIPAPFHDFVARSWERDEHTIYGRFDLAFDGSGPPRLLEYNADTPTALLEAAVIQWFWARDIVGPAGLGGSGPIDQFNSLHERLIEAWGRVRRELGGRAVFAAVGDAVEDVMTATYLRDTAMQGGMQTEALDVSQIGWHAGRRCFTDLRERPIEVLFKLYPWEWMLREAFGRHLPFAATRWLEPPWKMILSSKAILPILSDMFPDSPFLLRADFEPIGPTQVIKPIHSREGANVRIVEQGRVVAETGGDYDDGPKVYQEYCPLPDFDGRRPVIGSWMVNGHACGMGIREDDGPITGNASRFLPHLSRRSPGIKPPGGSPKGASAGGPNTDPLYDRWIDP